MTQLFEPSDITCCVGTMQKPSSEMRVPFFLGDYGAEFPTLGPMMARYKKIHLDIRDDGDGKHTLIATGDMLVIDLGKAAERVLKQSTTEGMLSEMARDAEPEFSVSYQVEADDWELFRTAREKLSGYWMLILCAEDAHEMLIAPDGTIRERRSRDRSAYDV